MSDYNEANIAGKRYRRCHQITIHNPYQGVPSIVFDEEDIIVISETESIRNPQTAISITFDPERIVQWVDMESLVPIPGRTISYGELYQYFFSAYIGAARDRDRAAATGP